ncbi:hypothetical protein MJD09_12110 [bacterium]|nr:hypothetical protein [bacterium]
MAGQIAVNSEITSTLLDMVDAIRHMLAHIESKNIESDADYSDLISALESLSAKKATSKSRRRKTPAKTPIEAANDLAEPDPSDEPGSSTEEADKAQTKRVNQSNIRVDVDLLDKLMNQVGELVLARNQILQFSGTQEDPSFTAVCHRLNLITTEMQEAVMKTRMQPISNIWNKFPRMVRDLAKDLSKKITPGAAQPKC